MLIYISFSAVADMLLFVFIYYIVLVNGYDGLWLNSVFLFFTMVNMVALKI